MLTQRLYVSIILCLLCFSAADAQPDTTGRPVETPEQAINLAWRYSGFDVFENLDIPESDRSAHQFTMQGSIVPTLADSIDGKPAWAVTFRNLYFDHGELKPSGTERAFDVEFIIEKQKGRLISVTAQRHDLESIASAAIDVYREYEDSLWMKMCSESYHDFPETPPTITMWQAFVIAERCSLASPKVTVRYVLDSLGCYQSGDIVAGWAISCLVASPLSDPDDPQSFNYRIERAVVNATTGKLLLSSYFHNP